MNLLFLVFTCCKFEEITNLIELNVSSHYVYPMHVYKQVVIYITAYIESFEANMPSKVSSIDIGIFISAAKQVFEGCIQELDKLLKNDSNNVFLFTRYATDFEFNSPSPEIDLVSKNPSLHIQNCILESYSSIVNLHSIFLQKFKLIVERSANKEVILPLMEVE